jgi:hypothetical protein
VALSAKGWVHLSLAHSQQAPIQTLVGRCLCHIAQCDRLHLQPDPSLGLDKTATPSNGAAFLLQTRVIVSFSEHVADGKVQLEQR